MDTSGLGLGLSAGGMPEVIVAVSPAGDPAFDGPLLLFTGPVCYG